MNTQTPETDAAVERCSDKYHRLYPDSRIRPVDDDFARKLELERNEALADAAVMRHCLELAHRNWSDVAHDATSSCIICKALATNAGRELLAELAELREWKRQSLAVENSWDNQAVARLLRIPLGEDIARNIQPKIEELLAEVKLAFEEGIKASGQTCLLIPAWNKSRARCVSEGEEVRGNMSVSPMEDLDLDWIDAMRADNAAAVQNLNSTLLAQLETKSELVKLFREEMFLKNSELQSALRREQDMSTLRAVNLEQLEAAQKALAEEKAIRLELDQNRAAAYAELTTLRRKVEAAKEMAEAVQVAACLGAYSNDYVREEAVAALTKWQEANK